MTIGQLKENDFFKFLKGKKTYQIKRYRPGSPVSYWDLWKGHYTTSPDKKIIKLKK
jgi:hypothetical protein